MKPIPLLAFSLSLLLPVTALWADEQAAVDGCIDQLRVVG